MYSLSLTKKGFRLVGLHFRPVGIRFRLVGLCVRSVGLPFRPVGLHFRPLGPWSSFLGLRFRHIPHQVTLKDLQVLGTPVAIAPTGSPALDIV